MEGPLFVTQNSTQVEAKEVMLCLKSCLLGIGEDTKGLSPQNLRIGVVSEVAERGVGISATNDGEMEK